MIDKELIEKIIRIKEVKKYTLYDLSKILDVQIATIERWLKTNRINKVYANLVKTKLEID
ncbi:MAG: hypothetical protein PHX78_08055 [bacterium]|nr:hypothetical protein [bacterium]